MIYGQLWFKIAFQLSIPVIIIIMFKRKYGIISPFISFFRCCFMEISVENKNPEMKKNNIKKKGV